MLKVLLREKSFKDDDLEMIVSEMVGVILEYNERETELGRRGIRRIINRARAPLLSRRRQ